MGVSRLSPGWTIEATATSGGSIEPFGRIAVQPGASQSYSILAKPGNVLRALLVDGAEVSAGPSFTFRDVSAAHSITALFADAALAPPAAVTPLAPSGVLSSGQPTYQWTAQPGADSYLLWVGTGSASAFSVWYTAGAAGCGTGTGVSSATPATP